MRERGYTLEQDYIPKGACCRPGTPMSGIESYTIHWIGPYPGQTVYEPREWWIASQGEAAAHFIVREDTVLACIPMNEQCYHCSSTYGNAHSVGIEVVPEDKAGRFSARTIETLKELLSDMPHVPLKRHWDWNGKECPLYYTPAGDGGDEAWERLKEELGYANTELS
jgi:N-acetylmuramoyl-L-alanine amidase CwlA